MKADVNFIFQEDAQCIFNHFTRLLDIKITFFTSDFTEVRTGANSIHTQEERPFIMTDCTIQPLLFSSLKSRKIQADFNGGALTSDAGALLLREVDKRIGLI